MDKKSLDDMADLGGIIAYLRVAETALGAVGYYEHNDWYDEVESMRARIFQIRTEAKVLLKKQQDMQHNGRWGVQGTGMGDIADKLVFSDRNRDACLEWIRQKYPQYVTDDNEQFLLDGESQILAARIVYVKGAESS